MVSIEPNMGAAGRRQRRLVGIGGTILTVAAFIGCIRNDLPWSMRLLVGFPATLAAVGWLQAARGTCVRRAAEGTFERDDRSTVVVSAEARDRSRVVARGIVRDAILIGFAVAALAAATAFLSFPSAPGT